MISGEYFTGDLKKGILPKIPNIYDQDRNLNRNAWMSPKVERTSPIRDF